MYNNYQARNFGHDLRSAQAPTRRSEEKRSMSSRLASLATWCVVVFALGPASAFGAESAPADLKIEPPDTVLDGKRASAQLIVTGSCRDGTLRDLSREGSWTSSDPGIAIVHPGGRIEPRGDGEAR